MQTFDHNIGFWEKGLFFAENCRKSQKIVIITSTPGSHHFLDLDFEKKKLFFFTIPQIYKPLIIYNCIQVIWYVT
jgi:hypothetical protein